MDDGCSISTGEVFALVTPLGAVVVVYDDDKTEVFSPTAFKRVEVEPIE